MEDLKQSIKNSNLIYSATRSFPNPVLVEDETGNDSDKTFTVAANKIYKILWIYVELATTADAGDRQVQIDFLDGENDVILSVKALSVQVASQTEYYLISPNGQEPKETTAGLHFIPLPPDSLLPAGYKVRVYDSAGIQVAADDMIVHMMTEQWDVS